MYRLTHIHTICLTAIFSFFYFDAMAQTGSNIELNKPDKYQNRKLPSEKTGEKKFTVLKRLYNNTASHYNYYFNANNKLNEIIDRAIELHVDDYTELLSFYNYSLNETSNGQIDTVINKCTAAILLHDLRSDWVDRTYLLLGKAYMHRKDFDSAAMVFQFINYAFAPKDDGYDIPIGSNESSTNGVFSISTNEKRNIWKKISSNPPARNESFLYQIRNYIEQNKLAEAEALLEIIRIDKLFPERLKTDWYEMEAYLQYNRQNYDSAAFYIIKSLNNTTTKLAKARWEYLAAQLFEKSGKDSASIYMYEKAIQHTTDPIMEVYARLKIVRLSAEKKSNALQENLNQLLALAKKDKYVGYRDIIYYAAAQLELKRKNYSAVEKHLLKSIETSENNELQKQKSYLLLGDVSYSSKKYIKSAGYYDSIQIAYLNQIDKDRVNNRKPSLDTIAANVFIINKEDSLQKIAAMPNAERALFLKNKLNKLRKEKGLKETDIDVSYGEGFPVSIADNIFKSTNTDEFYFASSSLKTKGINEFKAIWGSRPNIDNWRRKSAIDRSFNNPTEITSDVLIKENPKASKEIELSIEALTKELPLNPESINTSNEYILNALMSNGYIFQYYLQDYPTAIETYEEIFKRFPSAIPSEALLFYLNNCYNKIGAYNKADSLIKILNTQYPYGKFARKINVNNKKNTLSPAEAMYEDIYRSFLEGNFEHAKEKKIQADQQFGENYWTPQLLYIESIYYIKQRQDSIAIYRLQSINSLFPKTEMANKANTMMDVLRRRNEIESYLANLAIERPTEIVTRNTDLNNTNTTNIALANKDSLINTSTLKAPVPSAIAVAKTPIVPTLAEQFNFNATDSQYVVLSLNRVDPIFVSEAKNAFNRFNKERYYGQNIPISTIAINDTLQFLLIGAPFVNSAEAVTYIDRTKPLTNARIVPWLTADKYNYSFISTANLILLRKKKNPSAYMDFLHALFPDKF